MPRLCSVLDDESGTGLSLPEGGAAVWSPPQGSSWRQPQDFRAQYERERARANAAESRCEELRRAEREARSRAGMLKWNLDKSRGKLEAAVEEVEEVRRTAKNALGLQAEVTRLEKLLGQAGVESSKSSTIMGVSSRPQRHRIPALMRFRGDRGIRRRRSHRCSSLRTSGSLVLAALDGDGPTCPFR